MMSRVPRDQAVYLQLMTFAIEEVGDTPSSPCLVKVTPKAEKKRLIMNNVYRLISSDLS